MSIVRISRDIGLSLILLLLCTIVRAGPSHLHDGHIHYDQDVWEALPPERAVQMLRENDIRRALVSATPTEGAEMLYRIAPDLVIPMLRPYKSWRHRYLWFKDEQLEEYLQEHLARVPYRGFGEFHVFGQDMDTVQIEQMIALARERGLAIHPHTDLRGMEILLPKTEGVPVIWAHGGFEVPIKTLRILMERHEHLYIELSLRDGMFDEDDHLTATWQSFLADYPDRFLIGMDTYKPSRWAELPDLVEAAKNWLGQIDPVLAEKIARGNLDRLFPVETAAPR